MVDSGLAAAPTAPPEERIASSRRLDVLTVLTGSNQAELQHIDATTRRLAEMTSLTGQWVEEVAAQVLAAQVEPADVECEQAVVV